MKNSDLYTTKEIELFEKLENDVESGNYKPMDKKELDYEKTFFREVAVNTIKKKTKKKSLNIRLFEDDIEKIKAIALERGIPYQTLISSVIHKLALKQI